MKILFLHGYTQSGPLFNAKTKALQKALTKWLPLQPSASALHFPTAPHALVPADIPGAAPADNDDDNAAADLEAYGWWRRRRSPTTTTTTVDSSIIITVGVDVTLEFVADYLAENGPFAGVIGFSQGAALAAIVAARLERRDGWARGHAPLRFTVCYSGFCVSGFEERVATTPVLHVLGTLDAVVVEERSRKLVEMCERGEERLVFHPGGHYVPAGKAMLGVVVGFIKSCIEEEKEAADDEQY